MLDKEKLLDALHEIYEHEDKNANELSNKNYKYIYSAYRDQTAYIISKIKKREFDITQEACKWKEKPGYIDMYLSDCSQEIAFSTAYYSPDVGGDFKYCPYCSKPIEVIDDDREM